MDTYITFQYKPKGKRPDDITLTDVLTKLDASSQVPIIGDIVTLQLASNIREFQTSQPGNFHNFQVVGRNFVCSTEDGLGSGKLKRCDIFIIVTDVNDDVIGVDIKE